MNPIIAVTPSVSGHRLLVNKAYTSAVIEAGGSPVILSFLNPETHADNMKGILKAVKGLLLTGGGDVHSQYFDEPLHPKADFISLERDAFEVTLCRMALEMDIPVLGICRGAQVMNVARGGNLLQHIDNHNFEDRRAELVHDVRIEHDSLLYDIIKQATIGVNSIHHQAVDKLGIHCVATAYAEDGIIEAIELSDKAFAVGVQWHPEVLYANHPQAFAIFKRFIQNC